MLFLDELPEFHRRSLEVLRQPLEQGQVTISRPLNSTTFPARFVLVAAMNPCPCGYLGDARHACKCNPVQIERYTARISGPLLDRIDMHIEVPSVPFQELSAQRRRFGVDSHTLDSRMTTSQLHKHRALAEEGKGLLKAAIELRSKVGLPETTCPIVSLQPGYGAAGLRAATDTLLSARRPQADVLA